VTGPGRPPPLSLLAAQSCGLSLPLVEAAPPRPLPLTAPSKYAASRLAELQAGDFSQVGVPPKIRVRLAVSREAPRAPPPSGAIRPSETSRAVRISPPPTPRSRRSPPTAQSPLCSRGKAFEEVPASIVPPARAGEAEEEGPSGDTMPDRAAPKWHVNNSNGGWRRHTPKQVQCASPRSCATTRTGTAAGGFHRTQTFGAVRYRIRYKSVGVRLNHSKLENYTRLLPSARRVAVGVK